MARPEENQIPRKTDSGGLIEKLVSQRILLFGVAIIISLAAWYPATHLQFDQTIESLYSREDPFLTSYVQSREWFGGDEIAFLAYTDPDLESEESRVRLQTLAKQVAAVPGIDASSVQDYWSAILESRIPLVSIPQHELREMVRGVLLGTD